MNAWVSTCDLSYVGFVGRHNLSRPLLKISLDPALMLQGFHWTVSLPCGLKKKLLCSKTSMTCLGLNPIRYLSYESILSKHHPHYHTSMLAHKPPKDDWCSLWNIAPFASGLVSCWLALWCLAEKGFSLTDLSIELLDRKMTNYTDCASSIDNHEVCSSEGWC